VSGKCSSWWQHQRRFPISRQLRFRAWRTVIECSWRSRTKQ
jgi:hypothetical protein